MTTYIVSSGVTSSSLNISGGSELIVRSGGSAFNIEVQSNGLLIISNGGSVYDDDIGGSQLILAGGVASVTSVLSGGWNSVAGTAISTVLEYGGHQFITGGGVASDTVIHYSAVDTVVSGGLDIAASISSGGLLYASVGATVEDSFIQSGGRLTVHSGGVASVSLIDAFGAQYVSAGASALETTVYGGQEYVLDGGSAISTTVQSGGTAFVSSGGVLTGAHLLSGGAIDLLGFTFSSGATTSFDSATDMLSISAGSASTTLQLSGDYTGDYFHVASGTPGGVTITVDDTPCYCAGTRILTDRGEIEIKELVIGDRLITAGGAARPIKWIGQRSYAPVFARGKPMVLPVCIRQGALGEGLPKRDLFVSPLHAMFLDGVLVPARCLLNGNTILQPAYPAAIAYFHLELETHDIIIAEGALSESFIDDASRAMFHNAADHEARYPGAVDAPPVYCAPRVEDGPALQTIRRRLAAPGQTAGRKAA